IFSYKLHGKYGFRNLHPRRCGNLVLDRPEVCWKIAAGSYLWEVRVYSLLHVAGTISLLIVWEYSAGSSVAANISWATGSDNWRIDGASLGACIQRVAARIAGA